MLRAVRELLVEVGYQATTILAISRRAGVGAPTIYRRWPSREALIEDAAFGSMEPAAIPDVTGDLRSDLTLWVSMFLDRLADPVTRAAIPGLLRAYASDSDLYERLVNRTEHDARLFTRKALSNYLTELTETDLTARADAVFDFLVGSTMVRAITVGSTDREQFVDRTADALTALALSSWRPSEATENGGTK